MTFWQKFSAKFLFLILPFLLSACSSLFTGVDASNRNAIFEKKYSKNVAQIKANRAFPQGVSSDISVMQSAIQTPEDLGLRDQSYYAYVDVSKFGEKVPQTQLPTGEFYEQARAGNPSNSLPPDIFEVTYLTALYPPFHRVGAEFDAISIPAEDAYGIKTAMTQKAYLLSGGDALQRSVDVINFDKSDVDIELSEILIKERKQARLKEKMRKTFGENSVELAVLGDEKNQKKGDKIKSEVAVNKTSDSPLPTKSQDQSERPNLVSVLIKN